MMGLNDFRDEAGEFLARIGALDESNTKMLAMLEEEIQSFRDSLGNTDILRHQLYDILFILFSIASKYGMDLDSEWAKGRQKKNQKYPGTVLYNRIGEYYDSSRRADPYIVDRILHHLKIAPGKKYLDLACGTGNYTSAIAQQGVSMYGIDHSSVMIEAARRKNKVISWILGDVKSLPFDDNFFDGATCILSIHHLDNLKAVFQELFRVMDSGRVVLFTSSPEQMRGYWLNHYFPRAMEKSIRQMPEPDDILNLLKAAGFLNIYTDIYEVAGDLQDLFLYSGKHRPELYLEQSVRAGISTFASLADPGEVSEGCRKLENDIRSGAVWTVIDSYKHEQGDYMFIVSEKT